MLFYLIFLSSFGLNYLLLTTIFAASLTKWLSGFVFAGLVGYFSWQLAQLIWRLQMVPKPMVEPSNKCVLITGCDTGFGHRLARRLADYGFHVFAGCLRPDGDGARQLVAGGQLYKKRITVVPMDVTSDQSVQEARDLVDRQIGSKQLWAIVNNAGIFATTEIEFGDMKSFEDQMQVNCLGCVRSTRAFLPVLRRSQLGGRVINVASLAGRFAIPGMVGYCMSKCAVISFSDGLRREMKKFDIDVICIEPHLFKTNLVNDQVHQTNLIKAWQQTPEDVRQDYGDEYLRGYQNLLAKALDTARDGVDRVVETMETAVTHQSVSPYYRVMNRLERVRVWMFEFIWPTRVLDWISYVGAVWVTGLPASRGKVKGQ